MAQRDVAVIVGSLRQGSFSRHCALALMKLAPDNLKLGFVEIGDLPLYNQDLDTDAPPEAWVVFRDFIRPREAVLFVTPEYNRSVPGVLKNALDVGSRPYGRSVWSKKPTAVVSTSPGPIGGFGANQHLRQSFVFLDMPILQQPEAYVGNAGTLFTEDGEVTSDGSRRFLAGFMSAFAALIERVLA